VSLESEDDWSGPAARGLGSKAGLMDARAGDRCDSPQAPDCARPPLFYSGSHDGAHGECGAGPAPPSSIRSMKASRRADGGRLAQRRSARLIATLLQRKPIFDMEIGAQII